MSDFPCHLFIYLSGTEHINQHFYFASSVNETEFFYLFIYLFVFAPLCCSPKKPPTLPPTAQGETSLKLAPIYGVCSCQREIPFSLKKAH